jgi:antitoxin Phd
MKIDFETLIPFENLQTSSEEIFRLVDKHGQIVLLKNNAPAYVISTVDFFDSASQSADHAKPSVLTLQEAMKTVLMDADGYQMHASELADTIYERGLYKQKNGEKAKPNQMRARCGHYPDMFEALKGNVIRLRIENEPKWKH